MLELWKSSKSRGEILYRILRATCLLFGLAVPWSLSSGQTTQDVLSSPFVMGVTAIFGLALFFISIICLKRFSVIAVCGLIISIFTLLALTLYTA
jgi:hypothetical protein